MAKSRRTKYTITGILIFTVTWVSMLVVYSADKTLTAHKNALIIDGKKISIDERLAQKFKDNLEAQKDVDIPPVIRHSNFDVDDDSHDEEIVITRKPVQLQTNIENGKFLWS